MHKRRVALFVLAFSQAAFGASVPYGYTQTSYSIDLTSFSSNVTNMIAVECDSADNSNCGGPRLNYLGPTTGIAIGGQVTVLTNPFINGDVANPAQAAMLLGVVTDDNGQQHLAMFINPTAATAIDGQLSWSDLFPSTSESDVINNLLLATSGGQGWGNDWNTLSPGLWATLQFAVPMRSTGPGTGGFPGQTGLLPFFSLPAPGGTATNFDVVEFSDGAIIGSGSASLLTGGTPAVPEPGAFGLVVCGLAAVGVRLRRRT